MHKTIFIFWVSPFIRVAWKYISDVFFRFRMISGRYFESKQGFSIIFQKPQNRFLKRICLLAQNIPLFLPRSSGMVKPLLELCRVDPGDAFTYLSWSHIMSRSNFRICFKIFSNFIFYAYFLKGYFKALPEKLFSAAKTKFFHRIL